MSTVEAKETSGVTSLEPVIGIGTTSVDVNRQFTGRRGWHKFFIYRKPTRQQAGASESFPPEPSVRHRDLLNRITYRPKDVLRYISPTYGKPFHQLVQAAKDAGPQGSWRRVKVSGTAPTRLRLSDWAVGKIPGRADIDPCSVLIKLGRVMVSLPLLWVVLSFPYTRSRPEGMVHSYPGFLGRCWEYPKHARSKVDAHPRAPRMALDQQGHKFNVVGEQARLLTPRLLVVKVGDDWVLQPGDYRPYLFISHTSSHYPDAESKQELERMAKALAVEEGVDAYWLDYICRAQQQPELTDDVHRICDVTRGARKVCIALPEVSDARIREWGNRMWTLPEVLLAADDKIVVFSPKEQKTMTKTDIAGTAWLATWSDPNGQTYINDEQVETTRLLAEHYTKTATLSRLELISAALGALRFRYIQSDDPSRKADLAHALMALLQHRPRMDPTDDEFQALARLSLSNDSDSIVERMMCMLPANIPQNGSWFAGEDQFGAKLWDIEPKCQVAGVAHDSSVILDGCRGISIRWKNFPRLHYLNRITWKKLWAEIGLRGGPYLIWIGIGLRSSFVATSPVLAWVGVFLIIVSLIIVFTAPWCIVTLYGGKVWGQRPWLIGIEGTLPIETIERLTFGNSIGRFQYAPSSSLLCEGDNFERVGVQPHIHGKVPPGHRVFTLVDTGTMMVTVFSAVRPPSVALLCGNEGGMIRAALCSYDRSTNCLHKETVVRMETPMWDKAQLLSWVKVGG
ncbi:MAG: hypothetical protein M1837_001428 [Sclerophora amabilis]|nr:MAG: hypothetical protein M1837_001428 [Sclerophora amabilis]